MSLIYTPPGSGTPGDLITSDTHIEWDGLLMGDGTFFGYKELTGWDDLPGIDDGSFPRPRQHGDLPGALYGGNRVVTFTSQVWALDSGFYQQLRTELLRRTQIDNIEKPLVIRQLGETLQAWARVTAR